eukprot:365843-Chlamydomonas_euryale.AAC.1
MAGLRNALLVARSDAGTGTAAGSAGAWPRGDTVPLAGVVGHSAAAGWRHTALASLLNVTFVNYTANSQFVALEACGKCHEGEGGATMQVWRAWG